MTIIPLFQHSSIPGRRHKTTDVKRCMISIYYRNSETLDENEENIWLKVDSSTLTSDQIEIEDNEEDYA